MKLRRSLMIRFTSIFMTLIIQMESNATSSLDSLNKSAY